MKKIYLLVTALLLLLSGLSQAQDAGSNFAKIAAIPTNTPEMIQFQRYGDIPVGYNTGVPSISVPLGQIKLSGFEWPISLTYHSSGNKVADIASVVGLGWTLNAGGYISSRMLGAGSTPLKRYLNTNPLSDEVDGLNNCEIYSQVYHNEADVMTALNLVKYNDLYFPGIYYMSSPGMSGKFVLDDGVGYTVPISDKKISLQQNVFYVYDESGNKYTYGLKGQKSSFAGGGSVYDMLNYVYALTEVNTYKGESITFSYQKINYSYEDPEFEVQPTSMPGNCERCVIEKDYTKRANPINNTTDEFILTEINSSNGQKVTFAYGTRSDSPLNKRLTGIQFLQSTGNAFKLIKNYVLDSDYFGTTAANNLRLRLKSVSNVIEPGNPETHAFDYNATLLPNRLSKAVDYQGYYNGNQNISLLPSHGGRNPSAYHAQAAILTKITYPTKGYTTFEYELNPNNWCGLRIQKIANYDSDNTKITQKSYSYSDPGPKAMTFVKGESSYIIGITGNASDLDPIAHNNLDDVLWHVIPCGITTEQSSPITYKYEELFHTALSYTEVTEKSDDFINGTASNGKIIYRYNTLFQNVPASPKPTTMGFDPLLTEKEIYKVVNGVPSLLQKEEWHYTMTADNIYYPHDPLFYGQPANVREHRIFGTSIEMFRPAMSHRLVAEGVFRCFPALFAQTNYSFDIPVIYMSKRKVTNYETSGTLVNETQNTYDVAAGQILPYQVQTGNSDGSTTTKHLKYPFSNLTGMGYSTADQNAIAALAAANNLAVIWDKTEKGTVTITENQLYYANTNGKSLIYKMLSKSRSGASDKVSFIESYDSYNNPTCVYSEGGPKVTYLYSYGGRYPIAEIKNADYTSIQTALGESAINALAALYPDKATIDAFLAPLNTIQNIQIRKFSYEASVGMTSMTDEKGLTTYYYYDSFNRLQTVRDQNYKIIKAYCYNFKGQTTDCLVPFTVPNQSQAIYARVEIENVSNNSWSSPPYYSYQYTGDVYIRFYSDVTCTTPLTLMSGMTVDMVETYSYTDLFVSPPPTQYLNSYTIPANVNSYFLGNLILSGYEEYSGEDYYNVTLTNSTFEVVPRIENIYTPEATVSN